MKASSLLFSCFLFLIIYTSIIGECSYEKKIWVVVMVFVVLVVSLVFVGVKTEFFCLLESKEEVKTENQDKG